MPESSKIRILQNIIIQPSEEEDSKSCQICKDIYPLCLEIVKNYNDVNPSKFYSICEQIIANFSNEDIPSPGTYSRGSSIRNSIESSNSSDVELNWKVFDISPRRAINETTPSKKDFQSALKSNKSYNFEFENLGFHIETPQTEKKIVSNISRSPKKAKRSITFRDFNDVIETPIIYRNEQKEGLNSINEEFNASIKEIEDENVINTRLRERKTKKGNVSVKKRNISAEKVNGTAGSSKSPLKSTPRKSERVKRPVSKLFDMSIPKELPRKRPKSEVTKKTSWNGRELSINLTRNGTNINTTTNTTASFNKTVNKTRTLYSPTEYMNSPDFLNLMQVE